MANIDAAWEMPPRDACAEAAKYAVSDPGVFAAFKLVVDSRNALNLGEALAEMSDASRESSKHSEALVQATRQSAKHSEALVESARQSSQYSESLTKATKGLSTATWLLAVVAAIQLLVVVIGFFSGNGGN